MRVLIVEDDRGQRRTLAGLLRREGFDVTDCGRLKEAVDLLSRESFRVCVLDLRLENEFGIDVLRLLDESRRKQTRFIIHTGHGAFGSARDALNLGAFAFVEKLADPAELISQVHRAATDQIRQSLRQAEEDICFQVRLLDCVEQAVIATDVAGHVIYWNTFAEKMYGWSAAEAEGMRIVDLVVPVAEQVDALNILELLRRSQVWRGEFDVQHRDGRRFSIEVTDSPILDEGGQVVGIIGVSKDITERKQAELALQASERRYRMVVEGSGEAIIGLTCDGRVATWNQAAEHMFGYSAAEMHNASLERLIPPGCSDDPTALHSHVCNARSVSVFETQRLTKDGRLLHVILTLRPMLNELNEVVGIAGVLRDVTAFKKTQESLRQREAELAHLSRATSMGEMASALTHELNQPLGTAATYAGRCIDLLEAETVRPGELLEPLRIAHSQVMRAGEIIAKLKSFVSKAKPQQECVDLNDVAKRANELVPLRQSSGKVVRQLELHPHAVFVMADALQIEQVFVNLITNALHSIGETNGVAGKIVIRTTVTEGRAEGTVIDNGEGIASDRLDDIFEPYRTSRHNAMGMGLSICRTIIGNHGGRIWATSGPEGGACFTFSLSPLQTGDPPAQELAVAVACKSTTRTS